MAMGISRLWRGAGRLAAALLPVLALGAGAAAAQDASRVAVIDVQRLLTESKAGKEALEALRALKAQKDGQAEALQAEIKQLRDRLEEGKLSLSEEKQGEMEKQLEEKMIAFSRLTDDADREMEKQQEQAFNVIEKQVMPIIGEVGREKGYTAIFNKYQSGLLFALDEVDITDLILERYDQSGGEQGN